MDNLLKHSRAAVSAPPPLSLKFFFYCFVGTATIATGLQLIIEPTEKNVLSALICLISSMACLTYLFTRSNMENSPFSCFSIFGAVLIMLWGPLVYTTLEWRALTFELKVPYMTFGWGAVIALALCFAHFVYEKTGLRSILTKGGRFAFKSMGFFQRPPDLFFWAVGAVGFIAFMYIYYFRSEDVFTGTNQGILFKLVQGLTPFAYAPFVLLLLPYFDGKSRTFRMSNLVGCIIYFGLLMIGALLSNSRGVFALPIMTVLLLAAFLGFQGKLRINNGLRFIIVLCIPFSLMLLALLTDLALAMRIARANRANINAAVILSDTLSIMGDKKYMTSYREDLNSVSPDSLWSEYYLSSPFLSRFVNTKFADNTLAFTSDYSSEDLDEIKKFTWDRILVIFPTPILARLDLNVSKEYVLSQSMGDFMLMLAKGEKFPGMRSGSFLANGVMIWGYFFPLAVVAMAIPVFAFFDSLAAPLKNLIIQPAARRDRLPVSGGRQDLRTGMIAIAPFALIFIYDFFIFWTIESVSGVVLFLVRVILQKLILYWLFLKAYNFLSANR